MAASKMCIPRIRMKAPYSMKAVDLEDKTEGLSLVKNPFRSASFPPRSTADTADPAVGCLSQGIACDDGAPDIGFIPIDRNSASPDHRASCEG
jgi:hypothetical protein